MRLDTEKFDILERLIRERILILDGAMGSMIQSQCMCHDQETSSKLGDLLVLENPDLIKNIHREYLEAGADIIETDSFNANYFSLSDFGYEKESYNISRKAAEIARETADQFTNYNPKKPRFVAGSIGPTKHMLSLSSSKEISFDSMVDAYTTQIKGLLDGGADIILFETVFDTLTAKAGLYAISKIEEARGEKIPVMISGTIANSAGRLLSGQTIEAFYASVMHGNLLSIGLNCGFGSEQVVPYIRRLSEIADTAVSIYPNAGLPDDCGEYHEDPDVFALNLEECLKERLVNIVGGCCGTTPEHIKAIASICERYSPRPIPNRHAGLILSNLEISELGKSNEIIQVGERTNVAGSAKFSRLIREKNFDEALEIAVKQVKNGARIIDVCMDDAMENSCENMVRFLKMLNSDPVTGSVPIMIDSSDWEVITEGLKVCQGKGIVNSISLKDGEEEFLKRALEIKRLGSAMVVMLFDEKGQAATFERKCEIAKRAYKLLKDSGISPSDIIFDPNVLTVGTGLSVRDKLALDFIKATEWIKKNLIGVSVSGGISNLSFAFRGNNAVREAMHTVFLYHAGKAGLDMAIVNAGMLSLYNDIEPELLSCLEDLILCKKDNAIEGLISFLKNNAIDRQPESEAENHAERLTLPEKIGKALLRGNEKSIEELMHEALQKMEPMHIIEQLLMPQMKTIGQLFGEGKMFLPQVIKSAQVMKKAVSTLQPFLNAEDNASSGKKVIIATVKGDVHDIGKNIVGLVASCNGYDVIDLGVRVNENVIVDSAVNNKAEAILLSGLISPSLNEMIKVCEELERRNLKIPVIIGGAATSEIHTAVKIAPRYSGPVFYSSDASANLKIMTSINEEQIEINRRRQAELREKFISSRDTKSKFENEFKTGAVSFKKNEKDVIEPHRLERILINNLPISEVEKFIDWNWLLRSFDLEKNQDKIDREQAELSKVQVLTDVKELFKLIKSNSLIQLEGAVGIYEACGTDNALNIKTNEGIIRFIPMMRSESGPDKGKSVSDFLSDSKDYIAIFAVSAGKGLDLLTEKLNKENDFYKALLCKLICDRLAEAFARWVHNYVGKELWGFIDKGFEGVRIAVGYPSLPDHTIKRDLFEILKVEDDTSMRLTETAMITPSESVCGFIFSEGEYFNVGKISEDAMKKYSQLRNIDVEHLKTLIPNNF